MAILQQSSTLTSQEIKSRVRKGLINSGIAKQINERSSDLTENSKVVLERRYLSKDREGNILEDAEGMFIRVAKNLSKADLNYGATEEDRIRTEEEFADVMRCLEFLPNSPTIMNAGRELQQLSACFVLPVEDSLDSIFSMVKDTALIHKSGGGTGFSFSRVRPEGDVVGSTGGVASGPVSFINAFDAATDVVKQGGTRRGANMGILNVTHPDIVKFIRSKQDGKHLANFNISVAITEDFVDKVLKNEDYDLINPRTSQITGQLNAKEVFSLMTELAWETGDPGIVFMDRINRENPNPQLGTIESTNPCGEQPLLPYESCNLGSINLARMVCYTEEDTEVDWQRLSRVTKTAVHLLDNVIDMNNYPIHEIAEMSRTTRRIGVGVMGFSDLLVQLGIQYDSEEALTLGEEVMRIIQDEAYKASIELAETRGTFPSWEGSSYSQPGPNGRPILHMRNSAPVTIAPTGTISIIAGASSGIEPLFALSYVRNVMDNTRLIEGNPYFEAVARNEGFYTPELMEELTQTGSLERLDVPLWVKNLFRTSHDITPNWHVRMQAAFQRHTDNSVSKTINFPHSATISDVSEAYMLAYETGCKGITVYRDGSKSEQVLSTGETTKQSSDDPTISNIPRDRPREIHGITERVRTGHGNMYITINFDEKQRPFEVFGTLGKAGGCDSAQLEAISRLVSLALRSGINPEEVYNQLRGITCCPAWDDGTLVRSGPDAVALALERRLHPDSAVLPAPSTNSIQFDFTKDHQSNNHRTNGYQNQKCPDCNGDLHYQEGCAMCASCGWNKCE